jgi:hypothetical protein
MPQRPSRVALIVCTSRSSIYHSKTYLSEIRLPPDPATVDLLNPLRLAIEARDQCVASRESPSASVNRVSHFRTVSTERPSSAATPESRPASPRTAARCGGLD